MNANTHKPPVLLVTGASGQLGLAFRKAAGVTDFFDFRFADRTDLDVTVRSQVMRLVEQISPDAVINCAAYTNVERAESEEDLAYQVNSLAPRHIAEACRSTEALLVHFSTDYVFDGMSTKPYVETDKPNALSAYGRTKLEGERLLEEAHKRNLIVRTSWLFGTAGHNFYRTMLRLAKEQKELNVVSDQVASPTYTIRLAEDILNALHRILIETRPVDYGLYHYSHDGETSWQGFAKAIVEGHGLNTPVNAVRTAEFPTKAMRPAYSKLDASRWREMFGTPASSWQEELRRCIEEEQNFIS